MEKHRTSRRAPARRALSLFLLGASLLVGGTQAEARGRHGGHARHVDRAAQAHHGDRAQRSDRAHRGDRAPLAEIRGIASVYAERYAGRAMADGRPFSLGGENAASHSLPLGTVAMVTNLANGRTQRVRIQDRMPRTRVLVDLSPGTARKLGMIEPGLLNVSLRTVGGDRVYSDR